MISAVRIIFIETSRNFNKSFIKVYDEKSVTDTKYNLSFNIIQIMLSCDNVKLII